MANKNLKGITVEIGAETTGLTKALKNIDSQADKLQKELKQIEKLLKLDPTNTELLAQKQQLLAKSVETVETKFKVLKDAQEKVQKAFANNEAYQHAYAPLKTNIEETRDKLDKLKSKEAEVENKLKSGKISTEQYENYRRELENVEKEYQNLQKEKRNLEKEFNSKGGHLDEEAYRSYQRELISTEKELERLQQAHAEANKSGQDFSNKLSDISSKCDGVANAMQPITDKIVELGEELYSTSAEFENAIAKLDVIADTDLSDGTGETLENLENQALAISNATGIASSTVANLMYDGISAGQETAEVADFINEAVIKLSKVGFTEASKSMDILTTCLNAYKLESSEASKISDMLLTTQKQGKITVDELASSMGKVIPTAKSLNIGIDQLCAGYIVMTKNGVQARYSTTYMNSMLNELGKTGSDVDVALRRITETVQALSSEQLQILDDQYEQSEKSLDKSLEKREKSVEKSYEQQQRDLEKSIQKEISAKEEQLQKSIDMINEEYTEKLKLNDEERYNAIKSIEAQIDGINAQTEAEEKAIEERENNQKRLELQNKIATAETYEEMAEYEQQLAEFEENLALKQRKEERQAQIDALKSQKDAINEEYDVKAEKIKNQQEADIKIQEETNAEILSQFEETQNKKIDKLEEQKELELQNIQETNEAEKQAWQEFWDDKLTTAKIGSADGMGFAELIEDGYTLGDVMLLLQQYCDQTGTSFNDLWGNTNARKSANVLLDNAEEYAYQLEIVQNSDGAVHEAMTKLNTTITKVNKSFNRIKNSGIQLGSTMLEMVEPALDSLSGIVEKLTSAFNNFPTPVQKVIIVLGTILASIGPVAMIISKMSSGINTVIMILPTLSGIISGIGGAISGLFALVLAHPVIAVITAIIGGLILLYNKCDGFRNFVDEFFGEFQENWEIGADAIVVGWNNFKTTMSDGILYIGGKFKEKVDSIQGFFEGMFLAISIKVSEFKQNVVDGVDYVKTSVKAKVDEFVDNWKTGLQEIKDFFSNVFNSLEDIAKTPINAVIGLLNSMINGLNFAISGINGISIDPPDWLQDMGVGSLGFSIPILENIPMLANGGVLSSGSAIVGERGAELLTMMNNRAVVQPLGSDKKATAIGNTANTYNISVNVQSVNDRYDIRQIAIDLQNEIDLVNRGVGLG